MSRNPLKHDRQALIGKIVAQRPEINAFQLTQTPTKILLRLAAKPPQESKAT